jgi:hypothetical protein
VAPYYATGDQTGSIVVPIVLQNVGVSGAVFLGNMAIQITASTLSEVGVTSTFPPQPVTSSQANPVYVTGSVTVDDITIQDVTLAQGSVVTASIPGTVSVNVISGVSSSQSPLTASQVTLVAASTSSVTLASGNTNRKQLAFYNGSGGPCYTKLGTGASTASFTLIVAAGGYYELPTTSGIYVGTVTGIWEATTAGSASVTEVS